MQRPIALAFITSLLGLAACGSHTMNPDYSIGVTPTPDGTSYVAVPPNCADWKDENANLFDNQPMPQFGCANARNLAIMVDNPNDLMQGRNLDPARGVVISGAILRYDSSQTRGLIYPSQTPDTASDSTTSSTATSGLSGETQPASGSAGSSSSSSH
jgi:pilus assembly protein CpaD